MQSLSKELILNIFYYTGFEAVCRNSRVCKEWTELGKDEQLWYDFYRDYLEDWRYGKIYEYYHNIEKYEDDIDYKKLIKNEEVFNRAVLVEWKKDLREMRRIYFVYPIYPKPIKEDLDDYYYKYMDGKIDPWK